MRTSLQFARGMEWNEFVADRSRRRWRLPSRENSPHVPTHPQTYLLALLITVLPHHKVSSRSKLTTSTPPPSGDGVVLSLKSETREASEGTPPLLPFMNNSSQYPSCRNGSEALSSNSEAVKMSRLGSVACSMARGGGERGGRTNAVVVEARVRKCAARERVHRVIDMWPSSLPVCELRIHNVICVLREDSGV